MNKDRRKQIATIVARLEGIKSDVEIVQDDEQEALDALPSSLQDTEQAEKMNEALDALGEAIDQVEALSETLDAAKA